MTTTLTAFAGARRGNYCTLPTKDVEVLTGPALCTTCDEPLTYDRNARVFGAWVHTHLSQQAPHFASPMVRCAYCGTQDPALVRYVQAAWSDEVRCDRCGGVKGYAIGD